MKIHPNNQPRIGFKFRFLKGGITHTIIDDSSLFHKYAVDFWKLNNSDNITSSISKDYLIRGLKNKTIFTK
jgi:hypothetical protein